MITKMWTFGNSMSCSFTTDLQFAKEYLEYKGYEPKIYSEIISEKLGFELLNKANKGDNNYGILHAILQEIPNIKSEDLVIVQLHRKFRFRLVDENGNIEPIGQHWNSRYKITLNTKSDDGDKFVVNHKDEAEDLVSIVKLIIPNNRIIFWSPFQETSINHSMLKFYQFTTITKETNGLIQDKHYGEEGHKELADYVLTGILETNKTII
jgi:hypothetical protein